jgi:hypothetical protein
VAGLVHDGPLTSPGGGSGGGEASPQGVAGVAGRVETGALRRALHGPGDAAVGGSGRTEAAGAVDGAEQRAIDDADELGPGA